MRRLIDADILKKELSKMEDEYKASLNENCNDDPFSDGVLSALFQVFKTINSQLTAYNVDKVVERLEEVSNTSKTEPTDLGIVDEYKWIFFNDAIEVVKAGGIDGSI